jgi:hypothetical protein
MGSYWFSFYHTLQILIQSRRASVAVHHLSVQCTVIDCGIVKAWIHHNWAYLQNAEYPEIVLLEPAHAVTAEKSRGWFMHSGYNVY